LGVFMSENFRKGKIKIEKGRKPYIRKICKISRIGVWLVDGEYVRKNICEDFVNYAHHYNLGFIPRNEFWIAEGTEEGEIRYYIDHMLAEHRLISLGKSREEASEKASLAEKRERAKSAIVKRLGDIREHKKELIDRIHKKLLKTYSRKVKVWVVDGKLVRSTLYLDFGGGGHDEVFSFIPDNEVWIDDDIPREERKFIILHELHERNLMSRGADYPEGHRSATEIEDFFRHHPRKTVKAIKVEMKKQKTG
jgi:hypothetical protein